MGNPEDVRRVEESLAVREQVVLVVDDETDILESLQALLQAHLKGVRILAARSGIEGLALLRREPVDLILSDYKMPRMNGIEFLVEARRSAPSVLRVLITAYPDLELALRSINEAKIENFVTKPLNPLEIVETCRKLLYERRARQLRDASFARSLDELRRKADARAPRGGRR